MSREVREELAREPVEDADERRHEVIAACRFAGSLHVIGRGAPEGSGPYWVVRVHVGAVARRLYRTLVDDIGVRPSIEVHRPGDLRPHSRSDTSDVRLALRMSRPGGHDGTPGRDDPLRRLGLTDAAGRLATTEPQPEGHPARRGWLRGAFMVAASVSAAGRPPHLELACPTSAAAATAVHVLTEIGAPGAAASGRSGGDGTLRHRVVVKSGSQIGAVLVALGAHRAFLDRDLARLERRLRSNANRAANADRANLDRATRAAVRQVAEIEAALDEIDPADLPPEILETALARLANPGATLAEVGALLQPPVGRSAVHRRIRRLVERRPPPAGTGTA